MVIDDDLVVEEEETIEETEVPEEEPEIDQDEEEDRIVTIGDSDPDDAEGKEDENHQDPVQLVKKLRGVTRGMEKKNKALQRQLDEMKKSTVVEKPVELGIKPTLASCSYDDKKYEQDLIGYYERKRKVEETAAESAKVAEAQTKVWQGKQQAYVELKKEHNFKDFEDAEELVSTTFSITQQGIIVQGADDPALLVYALGKNPKKLEELAKISDPVDFAFKVAKLETQLKVQSKKAPKPETKISGGKAGGISGSSDKTLERLREEAAKTGDYTKVTQYKLEKRNK